jgi:nitroreductase
MALLDLIKQRRSIRKYLDKAVERDKIISCLEAARLAPSACNSQPWKFIVVDDEGMKNKLCDTAFRGLYQISAFAKTAPVIIAIVSEKSKFWARVGGKIRDIQYYLIDIGIAGEHFILQAQELGLRTCWIGWFDEQAVKSLLQVPQDKKVDILISLGYPETSYIPSKQVREPLKHLISFNSYLS